MNNNGPVLIVEDDEDDRELLIDVFRNLKLRNQILFFSSGQQALNYLRSSDTIPFLILSDINMPGLSGPELCDKIRNDDNLGRLQLPFVYFTTSTTKHAIAKAYDVAADGFFIKPNSYQELEDRIQTIVSYWVECQLPSDYS